MNALIIIDMQQGSIDSSNKYDSEGVIQRINLLSQNIRKDKGLVIFIQHDGTEEENLLPHTLGWDIVKALRKTNTDITIRKTTNDAFYNTSLNQVLQESNINNLIITGWATDFCVDNTIKSALSKDYKITVAKDCHTVSDREFMPAKNVIQYFNWLWLNILPTHSITVKSAAEILKV